MLETKTGYLRIVSQGEIDPLAFTLMGGTTKRGDTDKIGMFGSGLKYAISSLMRNKIDFTVFSGENKLNFTVRSTKFREDEFDVIYLNGKETSLTTLMGGTDWDTAFAPLREIYSNALDEDETSRIEWEQGTMFGYAGFTTFYIEGTDQVRDFFQNKEHYFLQGNPNVLTSNYAGSIYPTKNGKVRIFRKGILAYESDHQNAVFMYNSDEFQINESRVIKNRWNMERIVAGIWKTCENYITLTGFMMHLHESNHGSFERDLDFDSFGHNFKDHGHPKYSSAWRRYISEHKFVAWEHLDMFSDEEKQGRLCLKFDLIKDLLKEFESMDVLGITADSMHDNEFCSVVKNPPEQLINKVIDAFTILRETDYKRRIIETAPVEYVNFNKKSVLGRAKGGKIQLSVKLEDWDVSKIARIIIEETEHLKTELEDETREFQDHLFQLYYNQLIR